MTLLGRHAECAWLPASTAEGVALRRWAVAAGLVVLVAATLGLRLHGAGQWPFWGDELVTYYDAEMLTKTSYWNPQGYSSPHEQFIHACPLGFWIMSVWHGLVPKSEFAARLPMVVFSTLAVVTAVASVWRRRGPWVGASLGALLVFWPWGLFHAQNHRPYSMAYFFAVAGFLWADAGFAERRWGRLAWAAVFYLAAALCHSSVAMMLAVLVGCQAVMFVVDRRHRQTGHLLAAAVSMLALGVMVLLVRHFTGDFAEGTWWQMSPQRCLASLVNNMTLPVTLAALGTGVWVLATRQRDLYWALICAAALVAACVVGPLVMSFRADYAFAMVLPVHLLAAIGIAHLARYAWRRHWSLGLGGLAAVPALTLPSVASYYVDGNRPDYRSAAHIVAEQLEPGDSVWSDQCVNVRYYLSDHTVVACPPDPIGQTDAILEQDRRVWCILRYSTGGLPADRLAWLGRRFRLVADVHPLRFDYHQNGVAVFLADTPVTD